MAIRRECEETRARGLDSTAEEGFDGFQFHQTPKKQSLSMASSSGQPRRRRPPALMGAGEIVEVEGGHIVRGTGRKDRHSKVYTARGIRDRRVRLSAHTAIQFYDVQDRLGYDRPSKAVDWLMKHAKASIDELEHLPPWRPTQAPPPTDDAVVLPPSLDTDAIADTIKSFFPAAAAARCPPDLLSRTSSQSQDLRLSLHSFQDQIFQQQHQIAASAQQALLSDTAHLPFSNVWPEQRQSGGGGGGGGGYEPMHQLLGQTQIFTQRGSLQSSSPLPFRAWMDPIAHQMDQAAVHSSPAAIDAVGFSPGTGFDFDFSSFHIPVRIQGDIEHDGMSDELNSGSSA